MKKLLLFSVLFTLLSCGTGSSNSVNTTPNDSTKVDTTVVDSSAIDSTVCPD